MAKALDEVKDEPIRKVYLVKTLVKQGRFDDALEILLAAKEKLSESDSQLLERVRVRYSTSEAKLDKQIDDVRRMMSSSRS